jgi:hypothetical protein
LWLPGSSQAPLLGITGKQSHAGGKRMRHHEACLSLDTEQGSSQPRGTCPQHTFHVLPSSQNVRAGKGGDLHLPEARRRGRTRMLLPSGPARATPGRGRDASTPREVPGCCALRSPRGSPTAERGSAALGEERGGRRRTRKEGKPALSHPLRTLAPAGPPLPESGLRAPAEP